MMIIGVILLGLIAMFLWGIITGGTSNLKGGAKKGDEE